MNSVVPFSFEGSQVRVVEINGDPWFVAKDVAEALDYQWNGTKTIGHVPDEWKGVESDSTPRGKQEMLVLSEQGLYFFLGRSDKPKALPFQKLVADKILPSIRKTGRYEVPSRTPIMANPDQELVNDMFFAQTVAADLRMSEASRLLMFSKVAKIHNRPTAFLPDYTVENLTRSLTELLKEHNAGISAVKANTILVALGVLEEQTRPGSRGMTHKFKVLTEEGQKYGLNMTSPQNMRETQPHYYVATFSALLDLIHGWLREAAA